MDLQDINLTWIGDAEKEWIDSNSIKTENSPDSNSKELNLNVSIVRKKIGFDKLLEKFIALLGIHLATKPDSWERNILIVFLALIVCPIQLKIFKNNETKRVFDLIKSEYGDHYIMKKDIAKDKTLTKIVEKLERSGMIEREKNRYYFNVTVLKSVNIFKS